MRTRMQSQPSSSSSSRRRWLRVAYAVSIALWVLVVFASVRSLSSSLKRKSVVDGHHADEDPRVAGTSTVADEHTLRGESSPPPGGGGGGGGDGNPASVSEGREGVSDDDDDAWSVKGSATAPPDNPAQHLAAHEWRDCPCPQLAACADASREQTCLEYLGNYSNIESVRPMVSSLRIGRTAKLRLQYRNPCVQAIAKLPQSLFPLEPYAEYVAFETDRILGFGYVPPTTFAFIPMSDIESAASSFANKQRRRPKKGESPAPPQETDPTHEYARWISTEVLGYAMRKGLIIPHPESGRMVLGCSVQLFLRTVRPPSHTVLQDEEPFTILLRSPALYQLAMGENAARAFTAKTAMSAAGDAAQLIHSHRQRMRSPQHRARYDPQGHEEAAAADKDSRGESDDEDTAQLTKRELDAINAIVTTLSDMSSKRHAALPQVLRFLSDQSVFDAIIGNDDRGPIKNANVYVLDPALVPESCDLGGRRQWMTDERAASDGSPVKVPATVPVLRQVLLDQGKSFYKEQVLNPRLALPLDVHTAHCLFRRSTLSVLQQLKGGDLYRRLQHILPPQILGALGEQRLTWASHRAEIIADHARQCGIAFSGEARVAMWD